MKHSTKDVEADKSILNEAALDRVAGGRMKLPSAVTAGGLSGAGTGTPIDMQWAGYPQPLWP